MPACRVCRVDKPPTEFYASIKSMCKPCKVRTSRANERRSDETYVRSLYRQCRARHERDRHEGSVVTWDYFWERFHQQAGRCAVSGVRFDITDSMLSPSPDRIDNNAGYVHDNIQFVTWRVNNMRGNMPLSTFFHMCRLVTACQQTSDD